MTNLQRKLETAKRAATLHLLFKCSRLLNERALASLPNPPAGIRPRPAHLALFPHIDLERGARVSELAEKLGITRQAVSQLVDDLEQMGAVTRIPDREDKRAKRVVFTAEGKRSIIDGLAHLESLEPALEEILGERLMQSFRKALLMLHDHLTR